MERLLSNPEERHRIEIYNEYLRKIPDLLQQLETVENMYEKALLEEEFLSGKEQDNYSEALYRERLTHIQKQCEERAADIREQCRLILELKARIESESTALQALLPHPFEN